MLLQSQSEGLQIVALGGGHGLSTLLRGLKQYEHPIDLTAIVTVADDGGSSGRLRREMGVLPPGDFRNCLIALADAESLMTRLFQYRFGEGTGLDGHSFGNLFITAMGEITGSFERALAQSSQVLAVRGRVLPSTLKHVTLVAHIREAESGRVSRIVGESRIPQVNGAIERVFLEPEGVPAYPEAVRAILGADLILAGPGSLFTSVLPNLLVSDIAQAVRASRAVKMYVCNVATQKGETDHYSVADHVAVLDAHLGPGVFPIALANDNLGFERHLPDGVEIVRPGSGEAFQPRVQPAPILAAGTGAIESGPLEQVSQTALRADAACRVVTADLVDQDCPWRHDPIRLSRTILELYHAERSGK
jgi:uncharacterized cofD-like protein